MGVHLHGAQEQEEDDDWETKAETLQAPGMANGANSKRVRSAVAPSLPTNCLPWS